MEVLLGKERIYCGDLAKLWYDEACLKVVNSFDEPIQLMSITSECYKCDTIHWVDILANNTASLIVKTVHSLRYNYVYNNQSFCLNETSFGQHGLYSWGIGPSTDCNEVYEVKAPDDPYTPLYAVAGILVVLWLLWFAVKINAHWLSSLCSRNITSEMESDLGNPSYSGDSVALVQSALVPLRRMHRTRIHSLDTFRGLTIALMIFVNYGGGKYWFFKHAAWNGITVADFVFPWFAWIMGVSLLLRYNSELRSSTERSHVLLKSMKRAVILAALGCVLNMYNSNDVFTARIPGVLQRLAVSHFIVASIEIIFMTRQPLFQYRSWLAVGKLLDSWKQNFILIWLITIHLAVTFLLYVPGCPKGYLGPGGLHMHSNFSNCTGGAAGYIDRFAFGEKHIYQHPTSQSVYHSTQPFDPEGLLGTLSTCITVYLGVIFGRTILYFNSTKVRMVRWLIQAAIYGIVGGILCSWSKEEGVIPVNKNLWSLSFVLVTASLAFFVLSILFLVIDHFQLWSGAPLRQAGTNALLLYVGHIMTKSTFPWSWKPQDVTTHNEYIAMNTIGTCLWLLIAVFLERNSVFITV